MTTTDHRTVAEDMLTAAGSDDITVREQDYYLRAAQVHATLAALEQQERLAQSYHFIGGAL